MVRLKQKLLKLSKGDIIKVSFDPVVGHEQFGYRPSLIISDKVFHRSTGFALCLPITSKKKGLLFEIEIETKNISGVALPHGARMLDLQTRDFIFVDKVNTEVLKKAKIILTKIINE